MNALRVNEIFYSIQGEGARAGEASVFVRLQGCDLTCGFCDTEFASGQAVPVSVLADEIAHEGGARAKWIVWTGGEPCLQLNDEIVAYFASRGWMQAIETNGNHRVPQGLNHVCVSPKVAEHVLAKNFPDGVDELRYVRHAGQKSVPVPGIKARHYFLSPMFAGNQPDKANLAHCLKLCLENPQWKLSLQLHKLLGVL